MGILRLVLLVTALLLGSVAAPAFAEQGQEAGQSKETDAELVSSFVLVRLSGDAKMIGYPAVCPGTSPQEDQSQILCMAELYEAPVRVIRHLGGPRTDRALTIRFTAHSFYAVWRKDVRFLLSVVPFEDKGSTGHFAWQWDWENENGEFCKGTDALDDFPEAIGDFYRSGRVRKASRRDTDWETGYEIACVQPR